MDKEKEEPNEIDKKTFMRLLAKNSGFTLHDTGIFWQALVDTISASLANGYILNLHGLGKLYIRDIQMKNHAFHDIRKKEVGYRKAGRRVVFKISGMLKNIVKEYGKLEKEDEEE